MSVEVQPDGNLSGKKLPLSLCGQVNVLTVTVPIGRRHETEMHRFEMI